MPDRARRIINNTDSVILAEKTTSADAQKKIKWKCINPKCNVDMTLYNAGREGAYFASRRGQKNLHYGIGCMLSNISYNPHQYDESLFDENDFFTGILIGCSSANGKNNQPTSQSSSRNINNSEHSPIKTIYELYKARLHYGILGNINGVSFNAIIVDEDNYDYYSNGIDGNKVVRAVTYKAIDETQHIIFNYPRFIPHSTMYYNIAVHIPSIKLYKSISSRLLPKGSTWKTRSHVLICGFWEQNIVDGETIPTCEFTRPKKQIHLLKYD